MRKCGKDNFVVDYKNRNDERRKDAVTYEQLYSVMEYLIKAQMFTGEIRMSAYLRDHARLPYEKMSALEKQFDDKMTSLRNKQHKGNFHFEEAELPEGSLPKKAGQKTRYQWNVEAIRLLKQIEHEGRTATPEEQKVLARYVGWGGIAQAFDERNEGWQKEFGDYKFYDAKYAKHNFRIHDYFFAKALDKARAGGVVMFITSKGTMDKASPEVRKYIAQRAELLGAVRLPDNTFRANAGTEVTSDILILQKRDRVIDIEPDWVHLDTDENGVTIKK